MKIFGSFKNFCYICKCKILTDKDKPVEIMSIGYPLRVISWDKSLVTCGRTPYRRLGRANEAIKHKSVILFIKKIQKSLKIVWKFQKFLLCLYRERK